MKKSNKKGFTLVELVVVIAIIGVLAAILVPSMMGYVKKSRLKTANGNAKTAYNAVAEYAADQETKGTPVTWTSGSGNTYDCKTDASGVQHVLYSALADNGNEAGEAYVGGADINSKTTFFVHWRKTSSDTITGQYPEATADVDSCPAFGTWTAQ
ncbi:type II secretion system protein [uncultured Ruminococcus sp.]|uniref:type II secretion system protein n=1 Tax=uncultured Ruminococcus sp. TaxID=165186 RepID=UPI0025CFEB87|nr:type II secretion system protein [uncultured Ruminococcus sp.]